MPCPHYRIRISSRSKSPPSTAQAAYQSGERIYDERTNRIKDYRNKRGIVYTEIILPDNAPKEYSDRSTLWNAVEKAETNWNAQTARRIEIALPKELPIEAGIDMIREHCKQQFVSKGMIADIAIHDPDSPGHNPHAHVMLTMRAFDQAGQWLPKSRREYVLDEDGNRIKDEKGKWVFQKVFTTDWDNRGNAEQWRHAWEETQNRYLEAAGLNERISMKSYQRQGIDKIPEVHMGPAVAAMERKGIETDIGNLNREIKRINVLIAALRRAIVRIKQWLKYLTAGIAELDMDPAALPLVSLLSDRIKEQQLIIRDRQGLATSIDEDKNESQPFENILSFMRVNQINSVSDLDIKLSQTVSAEESLKCQIRDVGSQITLAEKLLAAGNQKARLDPIHDQYLNIHWTKRKEKFAQDYHEELTAWNRADKFIRRNLPDESFRAKAINDGFLALKSKLAGLNLELQSQQNTILMLNQVRDLIRRMVPELEPEGERLTQDSKAARQKSILERLRSPLSSSPQNHTTEHHIRKMRNNEREDL